MKFTCEAHYLIQFSGSPSQSVLHRNRSHESQPIGGVLANPFSKLTAVGIFVIIKNPAMKNISCINLELTILNVLKNPIFLFGKN